MIRAFKWDLFLARARPSEQCCTIAKIILIRGAVPVILLPTSSALYSIMCNRQHKGLNKTVCFPQAHRCAFSPAVDMDRPRMFALLVLRSALSLIFC